MSENEPIDREWLAFRGSLERAIGVPLGQYKEPQMKRRLASVMTRRGYTEWAQFAKAIAADRDLLNTVRDILTINVSEFFRQPERFLHLKTTVLPQLMKQHSPLRIWSAGCSIGCEPYTLSMLLAEIDPRGNHQIIATDVDMPILARAQAGTGYMPTETRAVPAEYLRKYLVETAGTWAVTPEVKRRVTFRRHDLLSDAYPQDMDLILCRNVVIYFTETAKAHVYNGFAKSLRPGGMLFVGGSEMIMRSHEIGFRAAGTGMYQRAA